MSVTPDAPDWAPHVATAAQIAATGVPLLRGTNKLGANNNTVVAPSTTVTLMTTVPVGQPSYEGLLALNLPAGQGTIPFSSVIFNWFDSVTTLNIDSEFFILTAGNGSSNVLQYYVRGPCHGDQLTVTITNLDPLVAMTLQWVINQTSHLWNVHKITQPVYATNAPIGWTNPAGTPALNLLVATAPTLAASASTDRLTAAYSGKAVLSLINQTSGAAVLAALRDPGTLYSGNSQQRYAAVELTGPAAATAEVALPNGPLDLQIVNLSTTTAVTPNVALIALDY